MQTDEGVKFDIIIPTFPVKDVGKSVEYYVEKLGFTVTGECAAACKTRIEDCAQLICQQLDTPGFIEAPAGRPRESRGWTEIVGYWRQIDWQSGPNRGRKAEAGARDQECVVAE